MTSNNRFLSLNENKRSGQAPNSNFVLTCRLFLPVLLASFSASAIDSGSSGRDGVLNPAVNVELQLPPSGIFNFKSISIPAGVTLRLRANEANTAAIFLVQESVDIQGVVDVSGSHGQSSTVTIRNFGSSSTLLPKSLPGFNPGGYPGSTIEYSSGFGPGHGVGVREGGRSAAFGACAGIGASHLESGTGQLDRLPALSKTNCTNRLTVQFTCDATCREPYGSVTLKPLLGGSGGGSGGRSNLFRFPAYESFTPALGGSGGGALLIAADDEINVDGSIVADGGDGGFGSVILNELRVYGSDAFETPAGGGSGGSVRLVANQVSGRGNISVDGGKGGQMITPEFPNGFPIGNAFDVDNRTGTVDITSDTQLVGGDGAAGRVRIEANRNFFFGEVIPTKSLSQGAAEGSLFLANEPTVEITSVTDNGFDGLCGYDYGFPVDSQRHLVRRDNSFLNLIEDPSRHLADILYCITTVSFVTQNVPVNATVDLDVIQPNERVGVISDSPGFGVGTTGDFTSAQRSVTFGNPPGRAIFSARGRASESTVTD